MGDVDREERGGEIGGEYEEEEEKSSGDRVVRCNLGAGRHVDYLGEVR